MVQETIFSKRHRDSQGSIGKFGFISHQSISEEQDSGIPSSSPKDEQEVAPVRSFVTIRTNQGLSIQQNNLTYRQLLSLVEKLEVLC